MKQRTNKSNVGSAVINRQSRPARQRLLPILAILVLALAGHVRAEEGRGPELPAPACDSLNVPEGNRLSSRLYAAGVQIYRWNGSSWAFIAPDAALFADSCYQGQVGTHYAGPTWEAVDGSKVTGVRQADCTPYRGAIPWLRLGATPLSNRGLFAGVTHILRVNTIGGTAPATAGEFVGDEARVPYTAEYYFYTATK